MRSLTLKDKIIIFKTFDISKIVDFSMMIKVPAEIIVELEKNTKTIYLAIYTKNQRRNYIFQLQRRGS